MRLVLDTNVWLDWLVFGDPAVAPIKAAVAQKRAQVFIDAACEAELERALGYDFGGKFTLDAEAQGACLAECRRVAKRIESEPAEAERAVAERIESEPAETERAVAEREVAERAVAEREVAERAVAKRAGLPRCRDKDDQKFLEAALAARADVLVTKDRALLDLARSRTTLPFRILTPEGFAAV